MLNNNYFYIGETKINQLVRCPGHPMKFDQMQILSDVVAKEINCFKIDVPNKDGRGWKRTYSEISSQDLGNRWSEQVADGAKYIMQETWVKANDPHYDAKVWPIAHPHGTGSVRSEHKAGAPQNHARNRLTQIQSWFRRTPLWGFWKYDWQIKKDLL